MCRVRGGSRRVVFFSDCVIGKETWTRENDDRYCALIPTYTDYSQAELLQRPYRIRRLVIAQVRHRRWKFDFFPAIYLLFIEKISGKGGGTEHV